MISSKVVSCSFPLSSPYRKLHRQEVQIQSVWVNKNGQKEVFLIFPTSNAEKYNHVVPRTQFCWQWLPADLEVMLSITEK